MSLVATGSDGEDAKQYIITSESDTGSLDVTADAGTYKVLGGGYAYITDTAEEKVYYGNETISVPKAGVWAVSYADTLEDVINEVKAKFSVTDVYDNGRGTISIEIPKYKHVMKITDAGLRESTGNFESNPNMEYLSENTELFGKTVRRIVRNPEIGDEAAASCRPLIFKHSAILDENGNKIPVGDVRYITINYYFESPEENPSLEGLAMEWTQGRYLDSAGAGDYVGNTASSLDYAGEAPNTIKANSWSTVTID